MKAPQRPVLTTLSPPLCQPYYDVVDNGRPSIPPGVYFRMLLVGFFEQIGSQRDSVACSLAMYRQPFAP